MRALELTQMAGAQSRLEEWDKKGKITGRRMITSFLMAVIETFRVTRMNFRMNDFY